MTKFSPIYIAMGDDFALGAEYITRFGVAVGASVAGDVDCIAGIFILAHSVVSLVFMVCRLAICQVVTRH